ncbi:MAG: membrane protein insertase YidC [Myxococcales bacterium]|nr:membrane protein insertase YidC [Myxococcales bacterium]
MERGGLQRILLIAAVFFGVFFIFKSCNKGNDKAAQLIFETYDRLDLPAGSPPSEACAIDTPAFRAEIAPSGGGLSSYTLKGPKYVEGNGPIDLAFRTTSDGKGGRFYDYAPLRTYFRNDKSQGQVPGDLVTFSVKKSGAGCELRHVRADGVEIVRTIQPSARPYELEVATTVKNLGSAKQKHAFSTALYALQLKSEEGGIFSRPSPNGTFTVGCSESGKVERRDHSAATKNWLLKSGNVDWAAISSNYLGQALVPEAGQGARCAILGEERREAAGAEPTQTLFRAYVAYPDRELSPNESVTYRQIAYLGPKDRDLLAAASGGRHLDQMIDLGTFAVIAKLLVRYLGFLHGIMGSWGIAIILLTVTVRLLLMPLTIPQIRSSLAMRRLKPELDAINAKFADDAQAKMLATTQLYKKNNVQPLLGCLPALLQMPVWFALYTSLQTAMELYHEKFALWHDLSAADPRYILPLVLGATMFVQQKVTPMQMDPAQQKMMLYFMPAMFTVFMLFLPAGLGVYMLTNSLLGILQTVAVERYYQSVEGGGGGGGTVTVKVTPTGKEPRPARELARKDS